MFITAVFIMGRFGKKLNNKNYGNKYIYCCTFIWKNPVIQYYMVVTDTGTRT